MQELSLSQPSILVTTVNELIDGFDRTNTACSEQFGEWVSAQSGACELPSSWENQLSAEEDELGYFCIETALSIIFKSVVASNVEKSPPTTYKELDTWCQKTAEGYYTGLSKGIYTWPFKKFKNNENISKLIKSFDIEEVVIENDDDALGKIYHSVFDRTLRKELGEFYTSGNIVNYLLDKSGYDNKLWKKRLMDPACGSGSFIISAVERLLKSQPDCISNAEAAYQICNSPLVVGFDINPFASEMARLRLFSTLYPYLSDGSEYKIRKLPIFNIDSLARDRTSINDSANQTLDQFTGGRDIKQEYIEKVHLQEIESASTDRDEDMLLDRLFAEYEDENVRPEAKTTFGLHDRVTGRILRDNVQYNVVVGNPPYIRIQKVPEERRSEYKQGFDSATGRFDLSVLFMEYGIDSLRDEGQIGFITSNKFLTTQYGEGIRAYLRANATVETLIDFTDTDVFDVTVLPCIVVATNGNSNAESLGYSVLKQADNLGKSKDCDDILSLIDKHLTDEFLKGRYTIKINRDAETVKLRCFETTLPKSKDSTWTFVPSKEKNIINKINRKKTADLGSIADKISVGIKTTANNVFVDPINKSTIKKYNLEEDLIHPAISGKNVSRWTVDWSPEDQNKPSYILYPHEVINGSVEPVNIDNYPNTKKYLKENYEQLAGRTYLEDAGRKWYECWVPQHPDYFDVDNKIITPEIASGNSFTLDTTGFFCIGSCYSVLLEQESPLLYRYLTGLLNSDLIEFYLKADSSTQLYADRFRYNKSYIENLPILYSDPSEINEESVNSTSDLDLVSETMVYISSIVKNLNENKIELEHAEEEINKMIYQIFDIDEEENEVIQQYLNFNSSK